jgi:hypothetical protein
MTALRLNAALGAAVVTIGFWLVRGDLSLASAVLVALAVAAFLLWRSATISEVWAWSTLLLGVESFAWPVVTMAQVRMATSEGMEPNDQQMGLILTAVLFGLFSAIFWLSFSYGIFKRMVWKQPEAGNSADTVQKK